MVLVLLIVYQTGDWALSRVLVLGLLLTAILLWALAALMIWGIKRMLEKRRSVWHFALMNLTRNAKASIVQVMAFGVGLMVLLLLTVVRGDLLQAWAEGLADNAPNRFVINIQPDQVSAVKKFFVARQMPDIEFFPMVRGRLTDARAKRLAEREFNLSWADQLQADNKIVQGHWWSGQREFSVEEGIAKTLGIKLGDQLTYLIAGVPVSATVTSLRSVQWDSFHANFFVVAPPAVLAGYPASFITSFFLPTGNARLLDELIKTFPNLTVIDIAAIMNQVRLIIERVSLAVEFVFLFTLAAGLMVMIAAIQSTLDVRFHENAVLRALGARRRRLWQNLMVEFFTLGSLAGVLAAIFASVLGYVIAQTILELDYVINPWLWVIGLLGGGVGVGLAGVIGTRQVVNSPPLKVLQRL